MNLKNYAMVLIIFIIITVSGCSQNSEASQYLDFARQFNNIYFDTVEIVDLSNTLKSLEELHSEKNKGNIEKLGVLVVEIKKNIPKDREKLYDNFKQRYEDLVFLEKSYQNFENLNKDERGRIDIILISIGMNKANWKDKKSTIVWE